MKTAFPSAEFLVEDPDEFDNVTYSLDCGSDTWRFIIANDSGEVTLAYDYDLDIILTSQYNCTVRATDTGYNQCNTSLLIKIKDLNDNTPHFNYTQYVFYISPNAAVGTQIGHVSANDNDVSEFGTITYNLKSDYANAYVHFDNGALYVSAVLSNFFQSGDVMKLNLTAVDYGGLYSTVSIWIVFPEVKL